MNLNDDTELKDALPIVSLHILGGGGIFFNPIPHFGNVWHVNYSK